MKRVILLLWLLAVMPSTEEATAALSKKPERVELEMVPLKQLTQEESLVQAASDPAHLEQVRQVRNGGVRMFTPGGGDIADGRTGYKLEGLFDNAWRESFGEHPDSLRPDFYYPQEREEKIAQGFSALATGWNNENAEDNKQLRQMAIDAFGQAWVEEYEKQESKAAQREIAGKRYVTEYLTLPGDKDWMPFNRYNDSIKDELEQDPSLYARDADTLWQGIQKKARAKYAADWAKRKAEMKARDEEGARLDELLYEFTSGKKTVLTPEEFNSLKQCGIPFASLNRARDAYKYALNGFNKFPGMLIGDDETARQLMLGTIRKYAAEREAGREFKNPVLNAMSSAWFATGEFLEKAIPTGVADQIVPSSDLLPKTKLTSEGLVSYPDKWKEAYSSVSKQTYRESLEIRGDVSNAINAGKEDYRKGTGYRMSRFAGSVVDIAGTVALFAHPVSAVIKERKLNNTILTVSLSVIGVIVGAYPLFLLCKASRKWGYEQWAAALAVVLLVLAVADSAIFPWWLSLPYGFYLFLRVIVAVLAAWQVARALMEKRHPLLFLLPACLCLIYQPLVKMPFARETWLWFNAASVFVLIIGSRRKKNSAENDA